jgi:hypothetical protein
VRADYHGDDHLPRRSLPSLEHQGQSTEPPGRRQTQTVIRGGGAAARRCFDKAPKIDRPVGAPGPRMRGAPADPVPGRTTNRLGAAPTLNLMTVTGSDLISVDAIPRPPLATTAWTDAVAAC